MSYISIMNASALSMFLDMTKITEQKGISVDPDLSSLSLVDGDSLTGSVVIIKTSDHGGQSLLKAEKYFCEYNNAETEMAISSSGAEKLIVYLYKFKTKFTV